VAYCACHRPQVFWPPVTTHVPTPQAVRDELARVLASGAFVRSDRQSHFLRFLVEGSLDGRQVELKESVIAWKCSGEHLATIPRSMA
jgi:hypothetical protein